MKYEILNGKGNTIAKFEHQYDRDICFDIINEDEELQKFDRE